jgi:D-alanine--D-alanine ligase
MGPCGENGNIMGLADLLGTHMIGCGIAASALAADKKLSKLVAESVGIPVVESLCVKRGQPVGKIVNAVEKTVGYPCFVKPTNLGTCSNVFKAIDQPDFIQKWSEVSYTNDLSDTYLVEKFIPNLEIRVFVFEDAKGQLHFNDQYATTLKEEVLNTGGGLFDHHENTLSAQVRKTIQEYSERIFRTFEMKDYARIDFFVTPEMQVYFNEANTQPFIGRYNMHLLKEDGYPITSWFKMMVEKNIS